eukprot:Opistho-2@22897
MSGPTVDSRGRECVGGSGREWAAWRALAFGIGHSLLLVWRSGVVGVRCGRRGSSLWVVVCRSRRCRHCLRLGLLAVVRSILTEAARGPSCPVSVLSRLLICSPTVCYVGIIILYLVLVKQPASHYQGSPCSLIIARLD